MDRWDRVGRFAAYGAALALTPYLLIKVSWVVGSLLGLLPVGAGFGKAEWVVLNSATIGMAGIGIAMALALVRPWGTRIPGAPLVFCAWVGTGFLVPVLPYAVLGSLLDAPESGSGTDPSMPVWEAVLVQIGFVGTGLGLALALPMYLRRRWPEAFTGRLGDGGGGSPGLPPWTAAVGAAVGLVWLYWAVGGTAGVAHRDDRDLVWHALSGVFGLWALAASAAVWAAVRGRPARVPRWGPTVLGWLGSGSLFAWSGWKLPFTLYLAVARPAGVSLPENLALAAVLHLAAVATGAAMLRTLVRARPASRDA
ncbi:hypothetical protein [Streptomyces uncialis]|uniref:LigA protein n=1 Tax=Streptomyces uncialis TaxID=1048205 RepID=A0A1Q4V9Q0_9ACTN|nr:hypothetical protein [Streptomyces uncialis]OKH94555.1 hypothetical protein AB852_09845 [Streptomyces uncialis]